ncbi:hypothetical protein ABZN20_13920 [Methylococcus sp. ANG]|uniref:hypothetical protein n=1 Tax=Methylococcus sp. ANG TaxID=3231903 RepID=UPI0034591FC8
MMTFWNRVRSREARAHVAAVLFLLLPAKLLADENNGKTKMECYKKALECNFVLVKGNYFRAIHAVYEQDFKNKLMSRSRGSSEQAEYLSDIDNYDFYVELKDGYYEIAVGGTMRPGAPDVFGAHHYKIDAKTYEIINKWQSK